MISTGFKKGFTLAEVLTTLMVIGVVAAMTIPTLINSTDDQQHKVALKKGISVLSQALQLNIAKEIECTIKDASSLCTCVAHSMSGSCAPAPGNDKAYTLATPDGMTYSFFYRGDTATAKEFDVACGSAAPTSEDTWAGKGSNCIVILDTNGFGKGAKNIGSDNTGIDDTYKQTGKTNDADKLGTSAVKDQYPLILTSAGVYPAITDYTSANGARGYEYMYGSGGATPWDSGKFFRSKNE